MTDVSVSYSRWREEHPGQMTERSSSLSAEILSLVESHKGIFLDVGCSDHKMEGSVGMDIRPARGVDIVHDMTVTPWPLPDACCWRILASHILEHIRPDVVFAVLDECWRVMKVGGQLCISMPYAGSFRAYQDPSHYRCWNEACCTYYDPAYPLYAVYRPRPWRVDVNVMNQLGDIHNVLSKRSLDDAATCQYWA